MNASNSSITRPLTRGKLTKEAADLKPYATAKRGTGPNTFGGKSAKGAVLDAL